MTITLNFECEPAKHDLIQFQKEGHFVPGMKDENGYRRHWEGTDVHTLTLRHAESNREPVQLLHVVADSPEESERLMRQAIQLTLSAQARADQQIVFDRAQWLELNERRNQFQMFLNSHYAHEIETGEHATFKDVFDAAVFYMRKERKRISVRILRALRGQKAITGNDWMPQEWRG